MRRSCALVRPKSITSGYGVVEFTVVVLRLAGFFLVLRLRQHRHVIVAGWSFVRKKV